MFILYALVIGLLAGGLMGGRFDGLARVKIAWGPLMLVGLFAQVLLFAEAIAARVGDLGVPLYVVSTSVVIVAVLRNWRLTGMPVVALGALFNLAAIISNGGYMPASPSAMATLGKSIPTVYSNSSLVQSPALPWLTDIWALPRGLPFANIFSVGDVLIGVGVGIVIVTAMRGARPAGLLPAELVSTERIAERLAAIVTAGRGASLVPAGRVASLVPAGGATSFVPAGGATSPVPAMRATSLVPARRATSLVPARRATSLVPARRATSLVPPARRATSLVPAMRARPEPAAMPTISFGAYTIV